MNSLELLDAVLFAMIQHGTKARQTTCLPWSIHVVRTAKFVCTFYAEVNNVQLLKPLEILIKAALFHDILEETDYNKHFLADEHGPYVAQIVKNLTSDAEAIAKVGKEAYLIDKIPNLDWDSLFVNLCHQLDNVGAYSKNGPVDKAEACAVQTLNILLALSARQWHVFRRLTYIILLASSDCLPKEHQLHTKIEKLLQVDWATQDVMATAHSCISEN